MLEVFALTFELDDCTLPDLIVCLAESVQLMHHGCIQIGKERSCGQDLSLLDFGKGVAQDARLFLDVLETERAVCFQLLKALGNRLEE